MYHGHLVTIVTSKTKKVQDALIVNGQVTKKLRGLSNAWPIADVQRPPAKIDFCNHLSQSVVDVIWRSILNSHDESVQGPYRQWPIGRLSDGRRCLVADGFLFKQDSYKPNDILQVVIRENKKKKVECWEYGQRPKDSVCPFVQPTVSGESMVILGEPESEHDVEIPFLF